MKHYDDKGPDPEGRGDGKHLFPDGKRWKKPSDYRPNTEDQNRTADIRLLRDQNLCRPAQVVYTFYFRVQGGERRQRRFFSTKWRSATDGFRLFATTLGVPVSLVEVKRCPFRPTGYDRPAKPDLRKPQALLDPTTEFPDDLLQYIHNQAARLARGNFEQAADLAQEALLRVCQTADLSKRREEAVRAMRASLEHEKTRRSLEKPQDFDNETF